MYPSYSEGFGIPILEAFQNNCPVILANASCFPEVGGNAALYFEPKNIKEFQHQLTKLICEPELRNELIEKGKKRLCEFSWIKAAHQTYKVYIFAKNTN